MDNELSSIQYTTRDRVNDKDLDDQNYLAKYLSIQDLSIDELKDALVRVIIEKEDMITENKSILQNFQDIISVVPGSIYWKNLQGTYLGCNKYMATTSDLSPAGIVGKSDFDLWPNEAVALNEHDQKVIQLGQALRIEESITLPTGRKKYFIVDKMPLRDPNGNISGIIGNSMDITKLKETQAALEFANNAKTEFIANMSHDIRTPLTGVIGMSKLLEEQAEDPECKQYAHWVNESGKQLLSLLNDILDVVSSNYVNDNCLVDEPFDLNKCVTDIAELELPTLKLKKLDFIINIPPNVPRFVISDHTKLHRILLNLVGNAIKFTEQGSIKIEIILVESSGDKVKLRFSVTDTGIGIPDDLQSKVFDRFFRVNPSYKGLYKGHGIGLHIAQSYVELLGGEIKLTSKINVGTSIFFEINVKTGPIPASLLNSDDNDSADKDSKSDTSKSLVFSSHPPYLLLVEDNPIALKMLEIAVSNAGGHYESTENALTALELAKSKTFDLVITDIGLPCMSGIELTAAIREREELAHNRKVPIIGLTAHTGEEEAKKCIKAGMNKVLVKPATFKIIHNLLEDYIVRKPHEEANPPSSPTINDLFDLSEYPLIDIAKGKEILGNEQLYKEVLALMLDNGLEEDKANLQQAHITGSWGKIQALAHKVKGGAGYCGMIQLHKICELVERHTKEEECNSHNRLYDQLIRVMEATVKQGAEWLKLNYL